MDERDEYDRLLRQLGEVDALLNRIESDREMAMAEQVELRLRLCERWTETVDKIRRIRPDWQPASQENASGEQRPASQ